MNWDDEVVITDEHETSGYQVFPDGSKGWARIESLDKVYSSTGVPMAKLILTYIDDETDRKAIIYDNMTVNVDNEGCLKRICSFATSIGLRSAKQARFVMHWDKVIGRCGRVTLKVEEYENREGQKRSNNKIKYWMWDEEEKRPPLPEAFSSSEASAEETEDAPW